MGHGFFIPVGDKTTCGGIVVSGDPRYKIDGLSVSRRGDRVTCGKDGRVYRISGDLR